MSSFESKHLTLAGLMLCLCGLGVSTRLFFVSIQPAVNIRHLIHPLAPFVMFQIQNIRALPMEVIGDVGYLLVQAVVGVAYDPPISTRSTSCSCWQCGQATVKAVLPSSLIWRYKACK